MFAFLCTDLPKKTLDMPLRKYWENLEAEPSTLTPLPEINLSTLLQTSIV